MKKIVHIFFLLLLMIGQGIVSFAEEKLVLTLEESINIALSQNPYHLASEKRIDMARAKLREAVANFFPTLNAQSQHTLDEKLFELIFPSFIPGEPPQRFSVDFTRDYQVSLSFSIPLFTGGRLSSGFKQAKYNLRSAEEAARKSEQDTIFRTKQAFYGVLLAKEFVKVAEEAVEVAEKHFKNVKSLYEVGMASKFDLLRSEVQVANLTPQLIKARNNLRIAELALKTILGLELDQPLELKGELKFIPYEPDLEEATIKALQNRPELMQLNYQRKMASEMMKLARSFHFPTIAVGGTYNFWGDRLNFGKDIWQSYYTINLILSVPIFNGFSTYAQVAESQALVKEIELQEKGMMEMIKFEVRQAILNLKEAKESLLSQEKNVAQAEESLRIAELNFNEGLVTTLDVSAAQAALSQAKTNYSQALYDYVISLAELDKAMGLTSSR